MDKNYRKLNRYVDYRVRKDYVIFDLFEIRNNLYG